MLMNNWELGIILPVFASDLESSAELTTMAASCICWKRPAEKYAEADVPWVSGELARQTTLPHRIDG